MLEEQIEKDIKAALLGGDAPRVSALRLIKSSLLSVKVDTGKRDTGLTNEEVLPILAKEAKKRQESADMYIQAGDQDRADKELYEKSVIEQYLPTQLTEAEINMVIDTVMGTVDATGAAAMGQVIGRVKAQLGAAADGALIAKLVKEKLGL